MKCIPYQYRHKGMQVIIKNANNVETCHSISLTSHFKIVFIHRQNVKPGTFLNYVTCRTKCVTYVH